MSAGLKLIDLLGVGPQALDAVAAAAGAEGYDHIGRLAAECRLGGQSFRAPGCGLLGAEAAGQDGPVIVAVGGVTQDPVDPTMLRMRRFYVQPDYRRLGVGARLAAALLEKARLTTGRIVVYAGDARAVAFWESLGFAGVAGRPHTHEYAPSARNEA